MTIIGYLYSGRNTWLRCSDECICSVEERIQQTLDQVPVSYWLQLEEAKDYAAMQFLLRTSDEWNEICGPAAEARTLNDIANSLIDQATDILAVAATKERLSGE